MVERTQNQLAIGTTQKLENLKAKIDANGNGLKGNEIINFKKFAQAEGVQDTDIDTYLKSIGLAVDKSDKKLHSEDIQEFKSEQKKRTSRGTKNKIINLRQQYMDKALEAFKAAKTPEEKAKIMDLVQSMPRVAEDTEAFAKQIEAWSKNFEAALADVKKKKEETIKAATTEEKSTKKAETTDKKPAKTTREDQTKDTPAKMQKFKVPAGWSVSQIAKAFGISKEDVLKANIDADGNKAYRTSKKGVEYFLIDQEINIPADAKLQQKIPAKKAEDKTKPERISDNTTPDKTKEKWHPPLLTPEQEEAQKKADEAKKKAEAEKAKKAQQAKDFEAKLKGEKPWIEEEQVQIPYMTKSQQRELEAKKKAEAEKAKRTQDAQDFEDKLNGKKPWF